MQITQDNFLPAISYLKGRGRLGVPKQESWMAEHLNKIPVRVMVGVGGAFDQIVDSSLRPPAWIHSLGLGWLYRLIREPWRIKRQLRLVEFVGMVFIEKLSKNAS